MGGEITWECIKTGPDIGKYIFSMKLYRDCDGVSLSTFAQTLDVHFHPTVTQITVDFVSNTDISPACDVTNSGNLALDCLNNPVGAVEEYVYTSLPVALPGVPPAGGWFFTWDSCCRNGATSNLVFASLPPGEGFTLRAAMYPYVDPSTGLFLPADPCFDSSPIFNETPQTIICTGYPFAYSHNASDSELDSIRYEWAEALDDMAFGVPYNPPVNPIFIPYVAPYSFNNPMPGNVNLDPVTGEISYNSNTSGNFSTVVKVDAYKCGQIVASIYREIQAVLISCAPMSGGGPNNPPQITAPIGTQTWITTLNPSGLPTYSTTVNAGELVVFDIVGTDNDIYSTGVSQSITMTISGGQMANDFISDTDCDNPPCATFLDLSNNPPPIIQPSIVSGFFEWQTSCSQILSDAGCGKKTNVFTFLVTVKDDFCPANAITIATMKITIDPAITQPAPDFKCVTRSNTGDINVTWDHWPDATNSTVYFIYGAENIGGPYSIVGQENFPNNSFSSSGISSNMNYFYMTLESLCADMSDASDTIMPVQFSIF
jgi:hypothetical protein